MDPLITELNRRYETVVNGFKNQKPDEFLAFDATYQYFCLIAQNHTVLSIVDEDRAITQSRINEINKSNVSDFEKQGSRERILRHSISFCYDEILNCVYLPKRKYKTSPVLPPQSEIIGNVKISHAKLWNAIYDSFSKVATWLFELFNRPSGSEFEARAALAKLDEHFRRGKYRLYIERLHEALVSSLIGAPVGQNPTSSITGVLFDQNKSILNIGGKEIKISLRGDKPDGHYVLSYIFENGVNKPADYVDIIESKFPGDDKDNASMYRACCDINDKVLKQVGIKGFLEIHSGNTGWVQINPNYL